MDLDDAPLATVTTDAELAAWLEGADERHQPSGDGCTCGWTDPLPSVGGVTWSDHRAVATVADLGDVLASNWETGGKKLPWSAVVQWLADSIDNRDD